MQNLTPAQAQALWDAGGFIILPDRPEGSEYGLDGTYHTIRQSFTGSKFIPPGLHLIVISPASSGGPSNLGPGAIPLRSGLFIYLKPRERLVLSYDPSTESISIPGGELVSVISDDHLRGLDPGLAAYHFEGLDSWKGLTSAITESVILDVLGNNKSGVDGMRGVEGDKDESIGERPEGVKKEDQMRFIQFDLRRSWRDGAVGEEITRWAKDKSYLLGKVIGDLGGHPSTLLAHLQLSFILVLHLSSPSSLTVYKRLISLIARSSDIHINPAAHTPIPKHGDLRNLFIELIQTIVAQLEALPAGVFGTELPELDVWFVEELGSLRSGICRALGRQGGLWEKLVDQHRVFAKWEELRNAARKKYGWVLGELSTSSGGIDLGEENGGSDDEDGEYAPVIVDL